MRKPVVCSRTEFFELSPSYLSACSTGPLQRIWMWIAIAAMVLVPVRLTAVARAVHQWMQERVPSARCSLVQDAYLLMRYLTGAFLFGQVATWVFGLR